MNSQACFYPIISIEHNSGRGLALDPVFDVAIIADFHGLGL
jgi:hypothetical protein